VTDRPPPPALSQHSHRVKQSIDCQQHRFLRQQKNDGSGVGAASSVLQNPASLQRCVLRPVTIPLCPPCALAERHKASGANDSGSPCTHMHSTPREYDTLSNIVVRTLDASIVGSVLQGYRLMIPPRIATSPPLEWTTLMFGAWLSKNAEKNADTSKQYIHLHLSIHGKMVHECMATAHHEFGVKVQGSTCLHPQPVGNTHATSATTGRGGFWGRTWHISVRQIVLERVIRMHC